MGANSGISQVFLLFEMQISPFEHLACLTSIFTGVWGFRVCWTWGDQLCQGGSRQKWGVRDAEENILLLVKNNPFLQSNPSSVTLFMACLHTWWLPCSAHFWEPPFNLHSSVSESLLYWAGCLEQWQFRERGGRTLTIFSNRLKLWGPKFCAIKQVKMQIIGRPVVVKLNSGVDYRGVNWMLFWFKTTLLVKFT